ncbi:MAG: dephospho-CoA kinase [Christensenellaceae bacterium]
MGGGKMIIGLMGNSGSGKSTVAQYLKEKGAYIIDADKIAHEICDVGQEGHKAVKAAFEPYFFNDDGSLNRHRMGMYVFANKEELKRLESVLHPIVIKRVKEQLHAAHEDLIVVDCALLVKTGLYKVVEEVWLVRASDDTKIERICKRDQIPMEQALNRLRNQLDEGVLMGYAQKIIVNEGTKEQLLEQVEEFLHDNEKK